MAFVGVQALRPVDLIGRSRYFPRGGILGWIIVLNRLNHAINWFYFRLVWMR